MPSNPFIVSEFPRCIRKPKRHQHQQNFGSSTQRGILFDDRHDDVDGFLHRLKRHEFVFPVAVFGAGEQVRGRQAFVRDDAAVRSAAHRFEDRRDAAGFISLHSQIDDDRMLLDDVAHIVVLVEQRQGNPRFGKLGVERRHLFGEETLAGSEAFPVMIADVVGLFDFIDGPALASQEVVAFVAAGAFRSLRLEAKLSQIDWRPAKR